MSYGQLVLLNMMSIYNLYEPFIKECECLLKEKYKNKEGENFPGGRPPELWVHSQPFIKHKWSELGGSQPLWFLHVHHEIKPHENPSEIIHSKFTDFSEDLHH